MDLDGEGVEIVRVQKRGVNQIDILAVLRTDAGRRTIPAGLESGLVFLPLPASRTMVPRKNESPGEEGAER